MKINQEKVKRIFLDNKCNVIRVLLKDHPMEITKHRGWYNIQTRGKILKIVTEDEVV